MLAVQDDIDWVATMNQPTEQSFLADVAEHVMTVVRDDGIHRHVRFQKPGSNNMYFELITWPGHLCYAGDMGTFVFNRLQDMFMFFRHDSRDGERLCINLSYWSEKLVAIDSSGGYQQYDPDTFRQTVARWVKEHFDEAGPSEEFLEALDEEVLAYAEHEHSARVAADSFDRDGFQFNDFWETDLTEYTYRFVWCCYALAWGIRKYDAHVALATEAERA